MKMEKELDDKIWICILQLREENKKLPLNKQISSIYFEGLADAGIMLDILQQRLSGNELFEQWILDCQYLYINKIKKMFNLTQEQKDLFDEFEGFVMAVKMYCNP